MLENQKERETDRERERVRNGRESFLRCKLEIERERGKKEGKKLKVIDKQSE